MDQELLKSNLNGLERKVILLLNEHKNLKEEAEKLKSENKGLRETLKLKEELVNNFKNQIKITKIADSIAPEDGSILELKKKVDEYIREIDKCIAHFSR